MKVIRILREAQLSLHRPPYVSWSVTESYEDKWGWLTTCIATGRTALEAIAKYKACRPTPPYVKPRIAHIMTWPYDTVENGRLFPAPGGHRGKNRFLRHAAIIDCPPRFTQTELRAQLKGQDFYGDTCVDIECKAVEAVREGDRIMLIVERGKPLPKCDGTYVDFQGASRSCMPGSEGCKLEGCRAAHAPMGGW